MHSATKGQNPRTTETTGTDPKGAEQPLSRLSLPLRWSEVLEAAFDYYWSDYLPSWALEETRFNRVGQLILISKRDNSWKAWEGVSWFSRPDVATLFELLPDLPSDDEYARLIRDFKTQGIADPENHFWEKVFTYRRAEVIERRFRRYVIVWL